RRAGGEGGEKGERAGCGDGDKKKQGTPGRQPPFPPAAEQISAMTGPAYLEISGLQKRFGATPALDGVDLSVREGEVHAIIGENGAGKSTLMNILAGSLRPDAGAISLQGFPYRPADPLEARRRGIAHIHQELSLCPHLSAAENIFLGREPHRVGWLDRRRLDHDGDDLLKTFHHPAITPQHRVSDLPPAARQIVEICRA